MKLKVVLHSDDGGYSASCPALPGCHSQGDTKQEALANIREAIEGHVAALNSRVAHVGAKDSIVDVDV